MNNWNRVEIPDLTGKVVIVTGANSGIGFQAAKAFASKGAETILACRNETKALIAVQQIRKKFPDTIAKFIPLDLASLTSIHRFADQLRKEYTRLDILLNNAGIILNPYSQTEDGFESHMGINHLGHFALTGLLLDLISATQGARVINVSSKIYRKGTMDFDPVHSTSPEGYSRFKAYTSSKLANLLFTYELDRRLQQENIKAKSVAVHPGYSYTDFGRGSLARALKYIFYPLVITITQSSARGALPSLRAAVDPEVRGGDFYGPGGWREIKGYPVKVRSNGASHDTNDARLLWEISEQLTGIKYL